MVMTEAVRLPKPRVAEVVGRPPVERPVPGETPVDRGGWTLMLLPTTICLVMFVVAFWW
jgi:hypothetical protein